MTTQSQNNTHVQRSTKLIVLVSLMSVFVPVSVVILLSPYFEIQLNNQKEILFLVLAIIVALGMQWSLLKIIPAKREILSPEEQVHATNEKLRYIFNVITRHIENATEFKNEGVNIIENPTDKLAAILVQRSETIADSVQTLISTLQFGSHDTLGNIKQSLTPLIDQTLDAISQYLTVSENIENHLCNQISTTQKLLINLRSELAAFVLNQSQQKTPPNLSTGIIETAELIDIYLKIEEAIDQQLAVVANDTNEAGMTLVTNMSTLRDSATGLVHYISESLSQISGMENEVNDCVQFIVNTGHFIKDIPSKIQADIQSIQKASSVIDSLGYLVDSIKDIGFQTDILAVNAAIQASHAGEAGLGFKIVADEVRKLALNSSKAAELIESGLNTARQTIHEGLKFKFLDEIMVQMDEAANIMDAVKRLDASHEDMRIYYGMLFSAINQNNLKLANDISDILDSIQYQDIVRQRIERIQFVMQQRNELLQQFIAELESSGGQMTDDFNIKMNTILNEYSISESSHHSSLSLNNGGTQSPQFELF